MCSHPELADSRRVFGCSLEILDMGFHALTSWWKPSSFGNCFLWCKLENATAVLHDAVNGKFPSSSHVGPSEAVLDVEVYSCLFMDLQPSFMPRRGNEITSITVYRSAL